LQVSDFVLIGIEIDKQALNYFYTHQGWVEEIENSEWMIDSNELFTKPK